MKGNKGDKTGRGRIDDAAAGLRICLWRFTNKAWAAYVFAVPLPVQGRHRPKAGWCFNYLSGNSSVCAVSRVHTHPQTRPQQGFRCSRPMDDKTASRETAGWLHGIGAGALSSPAKSMLAYSRSLSRRWYASMTRTVPDLDRITIDCVWAPPPL